jgi:hypothetical protein
LQAGPQVPQAESESVSLQLYSLQVRSARASSPQELSARCSLLLAQSPRQQELPPPACLLPVRQPEQPA